MIRTSSIPKGRVLTALASLSFLGAIVVLPLSAEGSEPPSVSDCGEMHNWNVYLHGELFAMEHTTSEGPILSPPGYSQILVGGAEARGDLHSSWKWGHVPSLTHLPCLQP
jgi:hypothetical protein